ncbi:uncharacterized protein LOC144768531 isoform X2 [Lissotriton helveticus]
MAPRGRKNPTTPAPDLEISASYLHSLNRASLQQLCKKLKIKANGKNTEMLGLLQAHYRINGHSSGPAAENSKEKPTPLQETPLQETPLQRTPLQPKSQTETYGHGWCLIHGMELRLPPTSWVSLALRGGRICVPHGKQMSPLLLVPSSTAVPPHLDDNYICQECATRNREKHALNEQRVKTSPASMLPPNTSFKSTQRARHKSGKYYPRENPDYARRVDDMLTKMAVGELDDSNVLCPSKPAVVHSPIVKHPAAK